MSDVVKGRPYRKGAASRGAVYMWTMVVVHDNERYAFYVHNIYASGIISHKNAPLPLPGNAEREKSCN